MRSWKFLTAVAAIALAGSLGAASAANWAPDYAQSPLGFEGKFGPKAMIGVFQRYTADIAFDAANLAASKVVVTVDMTSAKATNAAGFEADVNASLPTTDWFDAAKFPQGKFESTAFTAKGGDAYDVKGKLTLRGVTKDITLPMTIKTAGDGATAEGTLTLLRGDFGVGQGQWVLPNPVPFEVKVTVKLIAKKK